MDTILIVDDAEINRETLRFIFEDSYDILMAENGEEAIEILDRDREKILLVLLDLVMPKKNGIDVLKYMRGQKLIDDIPVIMITGESTADAEFQAYQYGAADIIYKPFEPRVVDKRTRNIIELYQHRKSIEEALSKRTEELRESEEKLARNNEFLINALGSVVEFRSTESGDHVQRVKDFTKVLLEHVRNQFPEYELELDQINLISQAAALHDVGKIAIPDSILNKPARLTADEFDTMKTHTTLGCDILKKFKQDESDFYKYCYEICRWHHEKHDGKGYPDGLAGDDIPIWSQVVAVADCFDALVSKRVYKDAYAIEKAFDMIKNGECGVFSAKLMHCFDLAKNEMFDLVKNQVVRS